MKNVSLSKKFFNQSNFTAVSNFLNINNNFRMSHQGLLIDFIYILCAKVMKKMPPERLSGLCMNARCKKLYILKSTNSVFFKLS